jgi:hypothetical protein
MPKRKLVVHAMNIFCLSLLLIWLGFVPPSVIATGFSPDKTEICNNLSASDKKASLANIAPAQKPIPFVVPFTYDPSRFPYIVVRAKINDGETWDFILDTGSGAGVTLFPWAVKEAKLPYRGGTFSVNNNSITAREVSGATVKLLTKWQGKELTTQVKLDAPNIIEIEEPPFLKMISNRKIAGILGGYTVQIFPSRLDFDEKTWTLFSGKVDFQAEKDKNPIILPYVVSEEDTVPRFHISLNNIKNVIYDLDTGSPATSFPAKYLKKMGESKKSKVQTFSQKVGSEEINSEYLFKKLQFGGLSLKDIPLVAQSMGDRYQLGLDIISRFNLCIDTVNKTILFEPRSNYVPIKSGYTGITYREVNGQFLVATVAPDAVFEEGAPKIGDEIVSIDGTAISGTSVFYVADILTGIEGTTASLEMKSSTTGKTYTVKCKRQPRF